MKFLCIPLRILTLALTIATPLSGNAQDKFYYWVTPNAPYRSEHQQGESFVIEVNAEQKAQIDQILAKPPGRAGFSGRVAAGAVYYNKDYYSAGQRVWSWHIGSVDGIFDFNETGFPAVVLPMYNDDPSDIEANPEEWIRKNGDRYTPLGYRIRAQIDPATSDAMANVSNRGQAAAGEKALITGLIIKGGQPRNVVVRALGPSLVASGVQEPAGNPSIEVFQGSRRIAANSNWKADGRSAALSTSYEALAPKDEKEAALLLTLMPGAYTLHGVNEDGPGGIMVLEAYDVDSTD